MISEESSMSLKVPVFNGDEKSFQSWWIMFQVYARVNFFHAVLKDAGVTITEAEMEMLEEKPSLAVRCAGARTADKEKQFKLGKKKITAMAHLTMAFGTEALLKKIASVSTVESPGGLAFKLFEILKEKCAPKDRMAVVERSRKLNAVTLKKGANPATLIKQIKAIDNQFCKLVQKLTKDDKTVAV